MDKNTIIGLVLMFLVIIGFGWYNSSQQQDLPPVEQTQTQPSQQTDSKQKATAQASVLTATDSTDIFFAATQGTQQQVVLRNNKVSVAIDTKGGCNSEVKLNEYKSYTDFEAGRENPLLLYTARHAGMDLVIDAKQ